jgi:hypothetical protein
MGPPHWGQDHVQVEGWRVEQPSSSPGCGSGVGGPAEGQREPDCAQCAWRERPDVGRVRRGRSGN